MTFKTLYKIQIHKSDICNIIFTGCFYLHRNTLKQLKKKQAKETKHPNEAD